MPVIDEVEYQRMNQEDIEAIREQMRKQNLEYIEEFEEDLRAIGRKQSTLNTHRKNLLIFLNQYLVRKNPRTIEEGAYDLMSFFYYYYIPEFMSANTLTVRGMAASIKQFYRSMAARGHVSQEACDTAVSDIKENVDDWKESTHRF